MHTDRHFFVLAFILGILVLATPAGAQGLGSEITVSAADWDQYLPQVAFNTQRNEFMVVWHDTPGTQTRTILGQRYSAEGAFIAEYVLVSELNYDNAQPSIAYDPVNDRYLLTYIRDTFGDGSDWDVHGRLIPWDGPLNTLTSFAICNFNTHQWNPKVAYAGTQQNFMVTWWNEGSGGGSSYVSAKVVTSAGVVLDPSSAITVASGVEERVAPDIAYNQARNEHLIVFQFMDAGGGHVYGARLAATGSLIAGGEFSIASWPAAETAPRVAASRVADEWGIAWQSDTDLAAKDIYARRLWVEANVVKFSDPVHVVSFGDNESNPDISAHSEKTSYLITWEQQYSNAAGPYGISARTLNTQNQMGTMFDVRGLFVSETTTCERPAIGSGPDTWFVAWEHLRDATPAYQDIHGRIVFASIFTDGFESGNTNMWSSVSP